MIGWIIVIALVFLGLTITSVALFVQSWKQHLVAQSSFILRGSGKSQDQQIADFKKKVREALTGLARKALISQQKKYWDHHVRSDNKAVVALVILCADLILVAMTLAILLSMR